MPTKNPPHPPTTMTLFKSTNSCMEKELDIFADSGYRGIEKQEEHKKQGQLVHRYDARREKSTPHHVCLGEPLPV